MRPFVTAHIALLALAGLFIAGAADAAPVEISGPYIHLQDLCERCDAAIGDVRIGESPIPGRTRVVRRAEVVRALAQEDLKVPARTIPGRVKVRRASREASREEMEGRVLSAVRDMLPGGLVLSSHGEIRAMTVPAGEFGVAAKPKNIMRPGQGSVPIIFSQDGVEFRELRLAITLAREILVPVATADLPTGTVIDGGRIELKKVRIEGDERRLATTPEEVVGTRLKSDVKAGEPFALSGIDRIPVVARGDGMTVQTIVGSIKVSARARALQEGAVGDRIRVEVSAVSKLLWVVVTGPGSGVVRQ